MINGRRIIEEIRGDVYLIGVDLPPAAEKGAANLRSVLDRALAVIAHDLYSKQTHFVLELIQNADDNSYPNDEVPRVEFEIAPDHVVVRNNETGFSEENVRALCDVGKSTKARRAGFIGEKGIGFKSVFAVSDRPEIHSNGFHFRFDRADASHLLGYVVPHWCGAEDDERGARGTTIVLPAKSGETFTRDVLAELQDELLLFLRRLRRLEIAERSSGTRRVFERVDDGRRVSLRSHDGEGNPLDSQLRNFVHVRHAFSMAEIIEEKRPDQADSELVLAFPVRQDGTADADTTHEVFAFLPIRDFGFRFLVQGDFLLSSSREEIHRNRPWNEAIRDRIADAFVAALPIFQCDPSLARSFLNFVPRKSDVLDPFFKGAAEQLRKELGDAPCVLAASGRWRRPREILLADERFRSLFSNEDIERVLGLEFAAPDLEVQTQTLELLGAISLGPQHVAALLAEESGLDNKPARWFASLYGYLATKVSQEAWLKRLREAPAIRLEGGALVKLADGEVFFPLEGGRKYGFEKELRLVNADVLEAPPDGANEVRTFLAKLGVKTTSPYSLIVNHILPRHETEDWKTSEATARVGHVRYLKDHLKDYVEGALAAGQQTPAAMDRLRTGIWLQTKRKASEATVYFRRPGQLYLGSEYQPDFDVEELLGEAADPVAFLSADYLPPKHRGRTGQDATDDRAAWQRFLWDLGVSPAPRAVTVRHGLSLDHQAGPELLPLLSAEDPAVRRRTIAGLDRYWSYYKSFCTAQIHERRNNTARPSRFLEQLRSMVAPTAKRVAVPLSDTYLDTEAVRGVFGDAVAYLDANVSSVAFMDAVGVVHKVDAAACLKRLDQLRHAGKMRRKDARSIYRELEKRFDRESATIKQAFGEKPLIFLPRDRWVAAGTVVWTSSGALLDSLYPALETSYPEHQTFFCKKVGVLREPSESALIEALRSLPAFDATPDERKREAFSIYKRLARALRDVGQGHLGHGPGWLNTLKTEALFLDHAERLVGAGDALYMDDDATLAEMFRNHDQVSLLAVDRAQLPQIQSLIQACGIPKLSEAVSTRLCTAEQARTDAELTSKIRARLAEIIRVVYAHSHPTFERAIEGGLWSALRSVQVKKAEALVIEATLAGESGQMAGDVYREAATIFIRSGARAALDKIALELCAFIGTKPDLADTMYRVLAASTTEEVEDFLSLRRIPVVPDDVLSRLDSAGVVEAPPSGDGTDPEEGEAGGLEDDGLGWQNGEDGPAPDYGAGDVATQSSGVPPSPLGTPGVGSGPGCTVQPVSPINATNKDTPDLSRDREVRRDGSGGVGVDGARVGDDASPPRPPTGAEVPAGAKTEASPGRAHVPRRDGNKREKRAATGRLMSYAEPAENSGDGKSTHQPEGGQSERLEISRAAVTYVLELERTAGSDVEEMPFTNEGFDILRRGPNGTEYFIEVKGQSGAWTEVGVAVTPAELRFAERHRDKYWLYVVEFAGQPDRRRLYRIQDPFGSTTQFRFDSGWKSLVRDHPEEPVKPASGIRITIPDVGTGVIHSVKWRGRLAKLHVYLDSGASIFRVFDPGKMRLSRS